MSLVRVSMLWNSQKKRNYSLEDSLVPVLYAVEIELPKIIKPRLPQNTSNLNIEITGKSKKLYCSCHQFLGALIYLEFIVLILICF